MQNLITKVEKISVFFIIYTLIFFIFFSTFKYTLPFILAFIFSLFLKYPTQFLIKKFNINIGLASFITTFIFFFLIIIFLTLFITSLAYEASSLTSYIQNLINSTSIDIQECYDNIQIWFKNVFVDNETLLFFKTAFSSSFKEIASFILSLGKALIEKIILFVSYLPYTIMLLIFTTLSTYFISKELNSFNFSKLLSNYLTSNYNQKVLTIIYEIKKMFLNYCLSYSFLIFLSTFVTFLGFTFLKVKYALLFSIFAGLFDILPILGMPLIYVPLIILYYLSGNIFTSISLTILLIFIFLLRQFLEPKLMSSTLGIHPLLMLICIFVGLELNGFTGIIFCMFFLIFFNIFRKVKLI